MPRPSALHLLLLLLLLLPHPTASFAYIGYLPEWRYAGANYRTLAAHLSHLLLFSAEPLPTGELSGLDRLPPPAQLAEARAAATAAGCQLLVCFGGNGRSSGFSAMTRSSTARARFVKAAAALVARERLDGIDINWEYPGYSFGSGYQSDAELEKDYRGLAALARELRAALGSNRTLTLAYYPDGCVLGCSPLTQLCSLRPHAHPTTLPHPTPLRRAGARRRCSSSTNCPPLCTTCTP
jgi:hypothetical protein